MNSKVRFQLKVIKTTKITISTTNIHEERVKFAILEMNELEAALSLIMELESGRLLLTRVREGGITDFLRKQNIPIIIRGNPLLRYTNEAVRRVAVRFRSEKQLLATFKGTRVKDAAFDGLSEAPWEYEALYPDPLGEQYVEVVQGIGGHSIEHVSLLASGGWAWRSWHIDSNPGGSIVSQLERGRKLWFFTTRTREVKTLCRKRIVPPLERLRSLPSTLRDDLLQFREHTVYCIQEPGDVVLFSPLTAHCVLTGPGPAALTTTTLKVEEAEEERVQRLGVQYQPQGVRRAIRQPGSRGRSRGRRRSRFS